MKEDRDHFLEEMSSYKTEEEKVQNKLLEKNIVLKGMAQSVVDLERT